MMLCLLALIVILAVHSLTLDGAMEGVKFYLVPDFSAMTEIGIGNVIFGALSQAFFTLSIGAGSMTIFGSYLGKDRSLLGESIHITVLDTFVALMAGLIIIPACFSFGVEPGAGPGLVFITLPNVFNQMAGGRLWGALFFLFMSFASLSTVIAVFENILSYSMDRKGWKGFIKEADTGEGLKFPANVQKYMLYVIPAIVVVIYLKGYYDMFSPKGPVVLAAWMVVSLLVLGLVGWIIFGKKKTKH